MRVWHETRGRADPAVSRHVFPVCVCGCMCQQVGERRWFTQSCILFANRTGFDALREFRPPPVVCCNLGDDIPPTDFFQGFLRPETRYSVRELWLSRTLYENLKNSAEKLRTHLTMTWRCLMTPIKVWKSRASICGSLPSAHLFVDDSQCVLSGETVVIKGERWVDLNKFLSLVRVTVSPKHKHEA